MIIDTQNSSEWDCRHFELNIQETITEEGRYGRYGGKVEADRCSGLPQIILEVFGYVDPKEYEPMTEDAAFLMIVDRSCQHRINLTPEEAEKLGEALIQIAADCRKYPDRRHV